MPKEKSGEFNVMSKQAMARAYSAMDYYFDHLKDSVAAAPSGGTEFGEKVKAYAEQNISATQEYVRELTYAKDIQDILRIQMGFMRSQLEAFGAAKDLGEAYINAASVKRGSHLRRGDTCPASTSRILVANPIARSPATLTISSSGAATGWI
jgi:Phasin protein